MSLLAVQAPGFNACGKWKYSTPFEGNVRRCGIDRAVGCLRRLLLRGLHNKRLAMLSYQCIVALSAVARQKYYRHCLEKLAGLRFPRSALVMWVSKSLAT
jgi:hypothetical protein